jgi:ABC-type transport system substrate-binding protein
VREAVRLVLEDRDPERAKELLFEADYPEGFTVYLRLPAFREVGGNEREAGRLAEQLGAIGIRVEMIR